MFVRVLLITGAFTVTANNTSTVCKSVTISMDILCVIKSVVSVGDIVKIFVKGSNYIKLGKTVKPDSVTVRVAVSLSGSIGKILIN